MSVLVSRVGISKRIKYNYQTNIDFPGNLPLDKSRFNIGTLEVAEISIHIDSACSSELWVGYVSVLVSRVGISKRIKYNYQTNIDFPGNPPLDTSRFNIGTLEEA